jgi:hypothetical protein
MTARIRFGTYLQEISVHQRRLSYNDLAPRIERDGAGRDLPHRPGRLTLRWLDVWRLLGPYFNVRLREQLKAVLPLAFYLFLFQILILRQDVSDSGVITAGLLGVVIGLMLFMEGLKVGLMPFGETIGHELPRKSTLPVVLIVVFLLGVGCTFAEPAIGALQTAGSIVDVTKAPYLFAMLNDWAGSLYLVVGAGVGLAAVAGTLRFLHGWSLKPLIYLSTIPALGLTALLSADPELNKILGVAWDCGGITTGPVTVPLVLSLGIGIAAAAGRGRSSLSGFGIVTLASIFPVIGVMLLGMVIGESTSAAEIVAAAQSAPPAAELPWHQRTPWLEIVMGVRAIVPLILFLLAVLYFVLDERVRDRTQSIYGLSLCVIGIVLFNIGLSYGLAKLGSQSGSIIPAAFTTIGNVYGSPLYPTALGIGVAALFAWFLGFGATLAEPALNALGATVESLTNGAFRKRLLMIAVSTGVAIGIGLGVLKMIYAFPLAWVLIPGYLLAMGMTVFSTEEFVNIAWDSAGVTTGPVTVPLVLAMGLGFGNALGAVDGFGILACASICPILSVLAAGLWIEWRIRRRHRADDSAAHVGAMLA